MSQAAINSNEGKKYCIYCGAVNFVDSKFCIKCGREFSNVGNFEKQDERQYTYSNQVNRCIKCMRPIKSGQKCTCGFEPHNYIVETYHILPGTVLKDRYFVGSVLGEGGFGITYTGLDIVLNRKIAIKELFLSGYSNRINTVSMEVISSSGNKALIYSKCMDRFLEEGQVMAKFGGNEGMVTIMDFFKLNNTAYIIMEFIEGENLKNYCKKHGLMDYRTLSNIMMPILNVLELIHNVNYIHRDLSPDNIMITPSGRGKLLDFGAARNFDFAEDKTLSVILKHGYAPIEQYSSKGHNGPWSDIYALCATMYYCLTGKTPSQAYDRMIADDVISVHEQVPSCPIQFSNVIMKGLSVEWNDRYQSIEELRKALDEKEWNKQEETQKIEEIVEKNEEKNKEEKIDPKDKKTEVIRDDIKTIVSLDDKTEILEKDINSFNENGKNTKGETENNLKYSIYLSDASKKTTQGELDNIKINIESTQVIKEEKKKWSKWKKWMPIGAAIVVFLVFVGGALVLSFSRSKINISKTPSNENSIVSQQESESSEKSEEKVSSKENNTTKENTTTAAANKSVDDGNKDKSETKKTEDDKTKYTLDALSSVEDIIYNVASLASTGSYDDLYEYFGSDEFSPFLEKINQIKTEVIYKTPYGMIGVYPIIKDNPDYAFYYGDFKQVGDTYIREGDGKYFIGYERYIFYSTCLWENDKPNGYAEVIEYRGSGEKYKISGEVENGLWNSDLDLNYEEPGDKRVFNYNPSFAHGYVEVIDYDKYGNIIIANCNNYKSERHHYWMRDKAQYRTYGFPGYAEYTIWR